MLRNQYQQKHVRKYVPDSGTVDFSIRLTFVNRSIEFHSKTSVRLYKTYFFRSHFQMGNDGLCGFHG